MENKDNLEEILKSIENIENLERASPTPYEPPKIRTRGWGFIPIIAAGLLAVVFGVKACLSSISSRQSSYSNQSSYNSDQKTEVLFDGNEVIINGARYEYDRKRHLIIDRNTGSVYDQDNNTIYEGWAGQIHNIFKDTEPTWENGIYKFNRRNR